VNDVNKDADEGLPPNKIVCVHGGMARSCSMCELERENETLKHKVEKLKEELEAGANEGV